MQYHILSAFLLAGLTFAGKDPSYCYRDNCLRALAATGKPEHAITASSDCRSALAVATVTATRGIAIATSQPAQTTLVLPRGNPVSGLPIYASACENIVRYSSACSCIGITGGNFTVTIPATTVTVNFNATATVTFSSTSLPAFTSSTITFSSSPKTSSSLPPFTNSTVLSSKTSSALSSTSSSLTTNTTSTIPSSTTSSPSSTTSSAVPSCTAGALNDPMNCGSCGTVCDSGICENGICTSSQCEAQTCGGFTNCNDNTNCFCFSSTHGTNGFCGANAVCSGLTPCLGDDDCNVTGSTGNICAVRTCCPQPSNAKPGICLQGQCGNPEAKLMMMAKARRFHGRTAAF